MELMTLIAPAHEMLKEFDSYVTIYAEFTAKLRTLTEEILLDRGLKVHSVTARVKTRDSLAKKLLKAEGKYAVLSEVTDLVGIRIITFFEDDVDRAAKAVEAEFLVDPDHSVDKRDLLDPDRFGYLSLHYVVSLSPGRSALPEYKRYADLKAEIQIRSVLQHAWAEIEHDLGYKTTLGVPRDVRRSFSRLAGLLELADKEFVSIRESLKEYEKALPERLERAPESVLLDKASLKAFIESSSVLQDLDRRIADFAGGGVKPAYEDSLEREVAGLRFLGFESVVQVEEALHKREDIILRFAADWLSGSKGGVVETISLLYFAYVLLGEGGNLERTVKYFQLLNIGGPLERGKDASRVIETFKRLSGK